MEADKKRLPGDTGRTGITAEVKELRRETCDLKDVLAVLTLEFRLLKKRMIADGHDPERDAPDLTSRRSTGSLTGYTSPQTDPGQPVRFPRWSGAGS